MATIIESITVQAPWLHGRGVTLQSWVQVGDAKFLKVTKADPSVVRLLTGHGIGDSRQLARTDLIEKMMAKREEKREQLLADAVNSIELPAKDDLGLDAPLPKRRRLAGAMPEIVSIVAPGHLTMCGIECRVLLGAHPLSPLMVEITESNLNYMRDFVKSQIDEGKTHVERPGAAVPQEDKVVSPASGVMWAWDRGAFRAKYKSEDGKFHWKDFRPSEHEQLTPSASVAADMATKFITENKQS